MKWRLFPQRGWLRRGSAPDAGPSCRELVELITDYLEGVLPADQARRVAAHLAACGGCSAYVEQMRATIRLLGRVPPESVSPAMEAELAEAFRGWKTG